MSTSLYSHCYEYNIDHYFYQDYHNVSIWVAQSVKPPILGLGSGYDIRVIRLSPVCLYNKRLLQQAYNLFTNL